MKPIYLANNKGIAWVSDEDYVYCIGYSWHLHNRAYAKAYCGGGRNNATQIFLHQLVATRMGLVGRIDHKDRNGFNCQRNNIRLANTTQNQINRGPRKDNQLGVKGVYEKQSGNYIAQIQYKGKRIHLGTYSTIELAKQARAKAEKEYYGEFSHYD